ncbi:unnamed protein product [Closterium sp. NIES-53]
MQLQEYDFKIRHCPKKTLQHVDGLSCNPPPAEEEARDEEKTSSLVLCMAAMTRGMQEADAARFKGSGPEDIWHDAEALRLVKGETEVEEEISDRARERAQYYWWYQQQLQVQSKEGWKMVPAPEEEGAD